MNICFFSDIHGNIFAYEAFLKDIENKSIDQFVFGGDFWGYYYYPDEIITSIRKKNWICLLGNHDKMLLDLLDGKIAEDRLIKKYGSIYKDVYNKISGENILFLRTLKSSYEITCFDYNIGFFHGSPADSLNGRIYPDTEINSDNIPIKYKYIFLGHTHHKMVRSVNNSIFINPGSLGQQRDGKGVSYVIFNTETLTIKFHIINYDTTRLANMVDKNDPKLVTMKEVLFRKR